MKQGGNMEMSQKLIPLPKQDNYEIAIRLSQERLRQEDPAALCVKSGTIYLPEENRLEIPFLHRCALLQWPEISLTWKQGKAVGLREQILLLHYVQTATGKLPTGEWISFAQVPGGEFYLEPFRHRSVHRLVEAFGHQPEELAPAARSLGGRITELGDVSVALPVFPRVSLSLVLWRGDEEIPPSGNVLFDSSIPEYLPLEDIVVLAGAIIGWLRRGWQD